MLIKKIVFSTIIFLVVFGSYSQIQSQNLKGNDILLDSLRRVGIPESDLAGYSKYLTHKKQHTNNLVIYRTDSLASCYNPDFELGNLTNWTGYTGNCCPVTATTPGIIPGRHTIMTGTGTDPYSNGDIPFLAPGGGSYSVRLGNDNVGSEAEKLVHKFLVTPQTTSFTYQYAVVLQDPDHESAAQPRFEVKVFDGNGALTPCGYYQVTAAANIPGFISVGDIRYKKWTTVGVDLSQYIGQIITIEFTIGDCSYGGHFGYAYIDATCEPLKIRKKFCPGDATATLIAPDGFTGYSWSTGHHTQTITVNHPHDGDTIWANLTSVTGCPTTLYAVLTQDTIPRTILATGDTLICPAGSALLHVNDAANYAWNVSGNTTIISTDQNPIVQPLQTTTYIATISNACGFLKDTVEVKVKPYTPLVAYKDTVICLGSSVPLSAVGNQNCTWLPPTGLSCTNCINPAASPTQTIKYYVQAIDTSSNCPLTDSVTIRVDSSFVNVYAGVDQTVCEGTTVYLGAAAIGAQHYSWTNGGSLNCDTCLDVLATPTITTTYVLTGSNNCATAKDSVTITVVPIPVADAGPIMNVCYGDTITLIGSGGSVGTDYQWSPSLSLSCFNCQSPTLIATTNQIYYLSVNSGGCYSNDTVSVRIKSAFHSITADQNICENVSVTLVAVNDSTQPLVWSPSIYLTCDTCATTIATPSTSVIYTVVGMDSTSCKGIDTVFINVTNIPVANAGPDKNLCKGNYVYLPGSGGGLYQWSPAQNIDCVTCSNPQVNPDTTTIYYLIASNACGADTDTVSVVVHDLPVITATTDMQICRWSGTNLTATGANVYVWSPSTNLTCFTCQSPTVTSVPNDITYFVRGSDAYGCYSFDSVKITALNLPPITASNDVEICIGAQTTLVASGQLTQLNWTPASSLSCNNCANPIANPSISTTYVATVTDPVTNCSNYDNVVVTVAYPPVAVVGPSKTICNGENAVLDVSGGVSYFWTPSTNLSCTTCSQTIASPTQTVTYSVTATNNCGSDQKTITVNVLSNPPANAGADKAGCIGDNFQINASGGNAGATYLWSPVTSLSCNNCTSPSLTALSTITYTFTVLNTNGCISLDDITITVNQKPNTAVSATCGLVCDGLEVVFINSGADAQNYLWDFGDGVTSTIKNPVHNYTNPSETHTAYLTASNGGCIDTAIVHVISIDPTNQLIIPNIFTPNGDLRNDCFTINVVDAISKPLLDCSTIIIYDRWGTKVFESYLSNCWNGKVDNTGKDVSDGVYYYIIETKYQKNSGVLTLVR